MGQATREELADAIRNYIRSGAAPPAAEVMTNPVSQYDDLAYLTQE